jgi:sporulation protein YlmC with PRC-barrel domain
MPDTQTAIGWRGYELIDRDGERIGTIREIYLDQQTNQPEWATVKTGLFGTQQTFVPIRDATSEGEIVRVPFEKGHVKDAPSVDPDKELSQAEERELYEHYGVDYSRGRSASQLPEGGGSPGQEQVTAERRATEMGTAREVTQQPSSEAGEEGEDGEGERGVAVPGESDPDEDESATSGERGVEEGATTERVAEEPAGPGDGGETRLRLKRWVVTEEVRVPVQREEIRVERDE